METGTATVENSMEVSQNIQNHLLAQQPLFWVYTRKFENIYSHIYAHPYVHCSFVHNSPEMAATEASFGGWLDKHRANAGLFPLDGLQQLGCGHAGGVRDGSLAGLKQRFLWNIRIQFWQDCGYIGECGKERASQIPNTEHPPQNCLWLLIELYSEEHQVPSETWSWNRLIRCH